MGIFERVSLALGETVTPLNSTTPIRMLVPTLGLTEIRSIPLSKFASTEIFRISSAIIQNTPISHNFLFSIPEVDFKSDFQPLSSDIIEVGGLPFPETKTSSGLTEFAQLLEAGTLISSDLFPPLSSNDFGVRGLLFPETVISANPFKTFHQFETHTWISGNLFSPLICSGTEGKNYARQRTKDTSQGLLFEGALAPAQRDEFKKAYKVTKTPYSTQVQKLTTWDLIYPILLPPLTLEFTPQLDLPHPLRDYQKTGISFLVDRESALLADEMGTGKTVMSTVALRLLFKTGRAGKALIICPVNLLKVWQDHLLSWASELEITVVRGTKDVRELDWKYPAHVYLTNYEIVRGDFLTDPLVGTEKLGEFDIVILDEAQHIKNRISDKSRAVKVVTPKYRWAITGTPIENKLDDLVSIFEFVKPNYLRGEGLTPSLASQYIKPYFLRRLKKDVMKDLPIKTKQETWLELEPSQRMEYEETKRVGTCELENLGEKVTKIHIFSLINKLKQICNFSKDGSSSKVSTLIDRVQEIKDSNQKVIVFTQYRDNGVDKLEKLLSRFGVAVMHGSMNLPSRNASIDRFRKDPNTTVFLSTIDTGGVGLTLTEASYVIHFDHKWNPAIMWQAEDRVHRHGQTRGVNIYSFWMQDTIEERIYQKLSEKGLLFEEVINGLSEGAIEQMISTEEWLEMLGIDTSKTARAKPKTELLKTTRTIPEILNLISNSDPIEFEEIVKTVFIKLGFSNVRTTKRSHDGGIDVIGYKHSVVGNKKVAAQCKRMSKVGVEVARELLGVITSDQQIAEGFIVTSGTVSSECRAFSEKDGRLSIIEGPLLANYIIQFGIPIRG